jgi:hypothetical protein
MITVAAICKNEIALISSWIKVLQESEIISNIIIADTGSTDGTIEEIKKCKNIELFEIPWNSDFSEARNFLIEKSKKYNSNFLWMLDIDEFPSVNLINKLKNDLKNLIKYDLIMFPYIEFWDFDKPCFKLPPRKTCLINDFIYYEPFKPNICLINNKIDFKYKNSLHEILDLDLNKVNSLFYSKSGNQIIPLNTIYDEYYISHFSFPKYKKAAKINNSSFEYELGLKRLNYRKIKSAITNNKEYTTDWANMDKTYQDIEQLGKDQINQFINIEGYTFPNLNLEKIKETNYYNIINE